MRSPRSFRSLFVVFALVTGVLSLSVAPAHAAWGTPSQVRSIGGTGRASLFPWGLAYNPVSQRYVVSDYFNYQIRQFGSDWSTKETLPQPTGADGDAESVLASVAVDPTNGDVYVGKPKPDTLAHYDAAGNRLPDVVVDPGSSAQTYTAWLTTDDTGAIYVLDSHLWNTDADPSRLIKLAPGGGSQLAVWDLRFPGQLATQAYGLDVAANGRIYIADSINRRIQIMAPDGSYFGSIGSAGGVGQVGGLSGDLRGVLIDDANQRIYVADALQNQIEVFSFSGTPLFHFGGEGTDPGQLIGPRQMTFGPDGHLWVSEYGNYRIQAFDPATGQSLEIQPQPLPERPAGQLGQPRDVAVDPATGNVWVADTWNQRFQEFSSDGTLLGSWGGRGNAPPYGLKYPRGIGFDPVNRRVWVTNNAAGTIYVYDDQANFLFQIGSEDNRMNSQPGFFEKPFGVTFGNGYAYVTDVGNTYAGNTVQVKILDALTGVEVGKINPRNAKSVDVDEATGEVYVAEAGVNQQKIFVYGPTGGAPLRSFGSKGTGNGMFTGLWGVTVANGTVYATDEAQSRIQAFTTAGVFLGKWGGLGTNPYQFRNPSGISHDATGRLYVADATNDRIVVFDPTVPKPAYEFSKPTIQLNTPANGSFLDAPVTVTGTAKDTKGIATVEISVRDNAAGSWWDPKTATWVASQTWGFAPWRGSPLDASWSWTFPGPQYERSYHVEVRVRDAQNTLSVVKSTDFTVHRFVPDNEAPETTLTDPADGSTPTMGIVQMNGTATDDQALGGIRVAVQHVNTGQWWTGTSWATAETWLSGALGSPGATASTWSYAWVPPATGNYRFLAAAADLAGNVDVSPATSTATLVLTGNDTVAPNGLINGLANNQVLPLAPVTFGGQATDDRGVSAVEIGIQNRDTLKWWKATTGTWVTAFTWNSGTTLATPGASPTAWSYAWTPPVAARYAVTVRARDAAGNVDASRPWINFVVA